MRFAIARAVPSGGGRDSAHAQAGAPATMTRTPASPYAHARLWEAPGMTHLRWHRERPEPTTPEN